MPRHWLVKTEPGTYSLDDLEREGTTPWGGVRNHAARNHLRAMREGDRVLVYHSNASPSAIVGVAEVAREAYPDPLQFNPAAGDTGYDPRSRPEAPTWVAVDLRFLARLPRPVPLDEVKRAPALAGMALVRISRLSVQPVTPREWATVERLAATAPSPPKPARKPAEATRTAKAATSAKAAKSSKPARKTTRKAGRRRG